MKPAEKIKTSILWVLFGSAVMMSFMIFSLKSPINLVQTQAVKPVDVGHYFDKDVSQYIRPETYILSFGGHSYSVVYKTDQQDELTRLSKQILTQTTYDKDKIEAIDEKTFLNILEKEGLKLVMPFDLFTGNINDIENMKWSKTLEDIYITEVFLDFNTKEIYFHDHKNQRAYKLYSQVSFEDLKAYSQSIRLGGYIDYRGIEYLYGLPANNEVSQTLVPLEYSKEIPNIIVSNPISNALASEDLDATSLVSKVFGNRFNFVKKMMDEKGAQIYMYGYGDKALKLEPSGKVTYRERVDKNNYKGATFYQALQIAIGRVEDYGYLPSNVYLDNYITYQDPSGFIVHDFYFAYKIKDYKVASLTGAPSLRVTITGQQLTYWEENLRTYVMSLQNKPIDQVTVTENHATGEFMNLNGIVSKNYSTLLNRYMEDQEVQWDQINEAEMTTTLLSNIQSMTMNYYSNGEEIEMLVPMWEIVIANRVYVFDAYTGERKNSYILMN